MHRCACVEHQELEAAAARLGRSGAMITDLSLEDRRYDRAECEPSWTAAAGLGMQ